MKTRKLLTASGRASGVDWREYTIDEMAAAMRASLAHDQRGLTAHRLSSVKNSANFCGTESIGEYIHMLAYGWPEGIRDAQGLEGLCSDDADKLTLVRDVAGAFPIVPVYLSGQPNNMLAPRIQQVETQRALSLVIDGSFSCAVKPETAKQYAFSVMALVAWLTAERIDCAITCVIASNQGSKRIIYSVPIKHHGDVLAPERIASIVHPSFLRRAWFACVEREFYDNDIKASKCCQTGFGSVGIPEMHELQQIMPDAQSVILLPKVGRTDPAKVVRESINLKLRATL